MLDLNAGLTQVLIDGTNTYLYDVGRIAQVNTTTVTDNRRAGFRARVDPPPGKPSLQSQVSPSPPTHP